MREFTVVPYYFRNPNQSKQRYFFHILSPSGKPVLGIETGYFMRKAETAFFNLDEVGMFDGEIYCGAGSLTCRSLRILNKGMVEMRDKRWYNEYLETTNFVRMLYHIREKNQ